MKPVKEMTFAELKIESAKFHNLKAWCSRQVEVNSELEARATRSWVHEDVFGEVQEPR